MSNRFRAWRNGLLAFGRFLFGGRKRISAPQKPAGGLLPLEIASSRFASTLPDPWTRPYLGKSDDERLSHFAALLWERAPLQIKTRNQENYTEAPKPYGRLAFVNRKPRLLDGATANGRDKVLATEIAVKVGDLVRAIELVKRQHG